MKVMLLETIVHRWLRVPYSLHVRYVSRPKRANTVVLFVHGLGDTGAMWEPVIHKLPENVAVVSVDLLGFGESPKPAWGTYDAREQARCLLSTYLRLGLRRKLIVVGHSLGGLVAIDFAKRYPLLISHLVLCSPPIYRLPANSGISRQREDVLRHLYSLAAKEPQRLVKMYTLAQKVGIGNPSLTVTLDNVTTFVATLRSSIINQRTINDIRRLTVPIHILYGVLDPFVVKPNLVRLAKEQKNISLEMVPAAHIIRGPYTSRVVSLLRKFLTPDN